MATKTLTSNLKLISTVLSIPPTTAQLPLGYMAFGLVNNKASIWGNYDGSVVDLVQSGSTGVEIVQTQGQSTTAVMSQKAVTDALYTLENTVEQNRQTQGTAIDNLSDELTTQMGLVYDVTNNLDNRLNTAENNISTLNTEKVSESTRNANGGFAGLDSNAKILPAQLPDYIMSNLLFGGTIAQNGTATLTEAFQGKFEIETPTIVLTATDFNEYPGVFFIAQDVSVFTNATIIGVTNVSTGDWIISLGTQWSKIDNTDAVVSVNGKTGVVTITLNELAGGSLTFTQAGTRANLATGDSLTTILGKLMKWYADLTAAGVLAFQTNVTSAQTPIATSAARGAVIVPATASGLTVDASGNVRTNVGNGLIINASNQLEADIEFVIGVI